jgi:hypothetical protein
MIHEYYGSLLARLGIHECLVQLLSQVDLVVQRGHLLLVVKQLLPTDLLHVAVLVVQPLHLSLCFLQG